MKNAFALALLAVISLAAILPLLAAQPDCYIYTFDGKTQMRRNAKILELELDMPLKNGDVIRIEPEAIIDFAFFHSVGLRIFGPSEILTRGVTSLSSLDLRVTSGEIFIHTEHSGESYDLSIETPLAVLRVVEPALARVVIEPADKKTKLNGKTTLYVKKGRVDVLIKVSESSLRMLENQKLEITPESYIPPAQGATPEEMKTVNDARSVFIPKPGGDGGF